MRAIDRAVVVLMFGLCGSAAVAQVTFPVALTNPSFEDEDVVFVSTVIPGWIESGPVISQFNPFTGQTETGQLLTGLFDNVPAALGAQPKPGSDPEPGPFGAPPVPQAAFISNTLVPEAPVGLSQVAGGSFLAGSAYRLTASVSQSLSFGMMLSPGAEFEMVLGYDDGGALVTVGSRSLAAGEIDGTRFVDFDFVTGLIGTEAAAAGEPIVVLFRPTVGTAGTYELDNVRLVRERAGCSEQDVTAPFGSVDMFDLIGLIARFEDGDAQADAAAPAGVLSGDDLIELVRLIGNGCEG